MTTWARDGAEATWRGYRVTKATTDRGNVYRCFAPNGAFLLVGGGDTAEEFQRFCEEHERKGKRDQED